VIKIIGEDLTARNSEGQLRVRIASVFPAAHTVVAIPEVPLHAFQREAFVEAMNVQRSEEGKAKMGEEEERMEMRSICLSTTGRC
jgi:hypothetical protein